jgi:hypothetical protein
MIRRVARIVGGYLAASLAAGVAVIVSHLIAGLVQGAPMLAPRSPIYVVLWTTWLTGYLAAVYAFIPAGADARRQPVLCQPACVLPGSPCRT